MTTAELAEPAMNVSKWNIAKKCRWPTSAYRDDGENT